MLTQCLEIKARVDCKLSSIVSTHTVYVMEHSHNKLHLNYFMNAIHPGAPKGKTWGPEAKFDLGELVILSCSIEAH